MKSNKLVGRVKNFSASKLGKESFIAMGGMALEYHNIFLFGYLASSILPHFFQKSSSLVAFCAILVSFVMGPLGAIICGHVGDTLGRRRILVWALAFVSISSFFMSVLPNYDQIGVLASWFFVIFRSIQTLGFGGDAVGLVTFILEEAPSEHRGFFGGLMSMGGAFGVLIASLELAILDPLGDPVSSWKWRSPLSLGVIGIFISIYFYKLIGETAVFRHYNPKEKKIAWPLLELLRFHKKGFIKSIGIFSLSPIITAVIFGFIPYFGLTTLALPSKFVMWINALVLGVFTISAPFFGKLSDRVGRKPILFGVSLTMLLLGLPMFYFFRHASPVVYACIQVFFSWVSSAYYGVSMTMNIEHLPTHLRYTGVAVSFTLSYALFGGVIGMHVISLLIANADMGTSPVLYLLLGAFVVLISTCSLTEEAKHSLEEI